MKTLFSFLMIGGLLFAGCKKDNTTTNNAPKTYLLNTATYTVLPFNTVSVDKYTYDSKNRVIEFNSAQRLFRDFKYTYDDNNNLTTVKTYDQNNVLMRTDNLTYSGNTITGQETNPDGSNAGAYVFTLNAQQQVVSSNITGSEQFTYDNNGNLTGFTACCSISESDTYTYDSHKHPLSMIGAKNWHLMYLAYGDPETFVNNITQDANAPSANSYTYNSDGFPLTSSTMATVSSGTHFNIAFDYIVK